MRQNGETAVDTVGRPLQEAQTLLESRGFQYSVRITCPPRPTFKVEHECLYVVRQHLAADGVYHLVVAAKMGKEV